MGFMNTSRRICKAILTGFIFPFCCVLVARAESFKLPMVTHGTFVPAETGVL